MPVDSPSPISPLTRLEIVTTLLASRVAAAATPVICTESSGDTTGAAVTWVYGSLLVEEPESICVASTPPIRPAANDTTTPMATKRIKRERRPRRALLDCSTTSIGAGGGNTKLIEQFYRLVRHLGAHRPVNLAHFLRQMALVHLDFNVNAGGNLEALQRLYRFGVGINDVNEALVNTHLKVLA